MEDYFANNFLTSQNNQIIIPMTVIIETFNQSNIYLTEKLWAKYFLMALKKFFSDYKNKIL